MFADKNVYSMKLWRCSSTCDCEESEILKKRNYIESNEVKPMETKSRYEILRELSDKKESLMREKMQLDFQLSERKRNLKRLQRSVDDEIELVNEFEHQLPDRKKNIDDVIAAADSSINLLQKTNKS